MFQVALGLVYTSLLVTTIYCMLLKPRSFFIFMVLLMFVSPTAQYLVYDGTGENYFTTTWRRLILEFINIALILGYIIRHRVRINTMSKYINGYYLLLFIWNFLHLFNIVLSLDPTRSMIFYLISVLGPSIFSILIINTDSSILPVGKLPAMVYRFSIFFFSVGILSVLYQVMKVGAYVPILMRTAGGMYLSNFSIALMSLFFPILLISTQLSKLDRLIKTSTILAVIIELLQALSRAGFGLYGLYFLYSRIKTPVNFILSVLIILSSFIVIDAGVKHYTKLSFTDAITHRFTGYGGDATAAALDDERLHLYFFAYDILSRNPTWISFGVGIGNYGLLRDHVITESKQNSRSLTFSNAHNLFLNNLIERGIFILLTLLIILSSIVFFGRKVLTYYDKRSTEYKVYKSLLHGFVLFVLIASFNMDLFVSAAYQCGLAAYMLLFTGSLLIKGYLNLQKQENDI